MLTPEEKKNIKTKVLQEFTGQSAIMGVSTNLLGSKVIKRTRDRLKKNKSGWYEWRD